ncbi:MAG: hypothetical protein COA96_07045 [SAR86 cluster bacterium]|uniref:PABS domain-containing protein n=1 Tax=SAR86 cluster bacterium TaxID=2030880 RepID=A0A2A5B250_9GAMM|nr:MAG: hypothetical protein COA96_07045 [SAR86 cluster bacterium]
MFPTCFLSGMLFPMFGEKLHSVIGVSTQSSGALTLANTFGAAIGSGLATFLLLPMLGIELSMLAISFCYLLIALLSFLSSTVGSRAKFALQAIGVASVLIIAIFPYGGINRSYQIFAQQTLPNEQLVSSTESVYATLHYYRKEVLGQAESYRLVTNGYSMSGSNFAGERYMKMFAYLPYILKDGIDDALLISYGVGNTAQGLTQIDSLKSLDIVDVSQDIIDLSIPAHREIGYGPLEDERTVVHIEDGRFFLQSTEKMYDLITGEPPPPKAPHIANLYSQEFFELTKEHLSPGGMISYWLPVHDLHASDSASIIKAFCNVYEDCSLWNGFDLDFIMIGTRGGLPALSMDAILRHWSNEGIQSELVRIALEKPAQLGNLFMADASRLTELTANIQPLTDNYPQRISPSTRGMRDRAELYSYLLNIEGRRAHFASSRYINELFPEEFITEAVNNFELQKLFMIGTNNPHIDYPLPYFWDALAFLLRSTQLQTLPLLLLSGNPRELEILAGSDANDTFEYKQSLIKKLVIDRNYQQSIKEIEDILVEHFDDVDIDYYRKLDTVLKGVVGGVEIERALNSPSFEIYDEEFRNWFVASFSN